MHSSSLRPGSVTTTATRTELSPALLGSLATLSLAAWAAVVVESRALSTDADPQHLLTMGLGPALFLGMWASMMVAMMLPPAAPVIGGFARLQRARSARGDPLVSTVLFASAYLALWIGFGAIAFVGAEEAASTANHSAFLMDNGARIGGAIFILAGLYQLSPPKSACLRRCRAPRDFVAENWRDGRLGGVVMGLRHGVDDLGCCWLLFVILFPVGIMNLAAMGLLTVLIFAEKVAPGGFVVARIAGLAMIAFGVAFLVAPGLLPTQVTMGSGMM
jgi:predicted metal-binding membrane protein